MGQGHLRREKGLVSPTPSAGKKGSGAAKGRGLNPHSSTRKIDEEKLEEGGLRHLRERSDLFVVLFAV